MGEINYVELKYGPFYENVWLIANFVHCFGLQNFHSMTWERCQCLPGSLACFLDCTSSDPNGRWLELSQEIRNTGPENKCLEGVDIECSGTCGFNAAVQWTRNGRCAGAACWQQFTVH